MERPRERYWSPSGLIAPWGERAEGNFLSAVPTSPAVCLAVRLSSCSGMNDCSASSRRLGQGWAEAEILFELRWDPGLTSRKMPKDWAVGEQVAPLGELWADFSTKEETKVLVHEARCLRDKIVTSSWVSCLCELGGGAGGGIILRFLPFFFLTNLYDPSPRTPPPRLWSYLFI